MRIPLSAWGSRYVRIMVLLALGVVHSTSSVGLEGQEMPPFPILYGGTATVNGEPLPEGARLVAKVGDYETWTNVEGGGKYRNLLVAPPSRDYYGVAVTFHTMGLAAVETDVFQSSKSPTFNSTGFDLHFQGSPEPSATQLAIKDTAAQGDKVEEDPGVPLNETTKITSGVAPQSDDDAPVYTDHSDTSGAATSEKAADAMRNNSQEADVSVQGDQVATENTMTPGAEASTQPLVSPSPPVKELQGVAARRGLSPMIWVLIVAGAVMGAFTVWLGLSRGGKR